VREAWSHHVYSFAGSSVGAGFTCFHQLVQPPWPAGRGLSGGFRAYTQPCPNVPFETRYTRTGSCRALRDASTRVGSAGAEVRREGDRGGRD